MPAKRTRSASKRPEATAVVEQAPPAPASVLSQQLAALGRSPFGYILASILILLPCYWQTRIQAGDLSSHIYNSWLAQLVDAGKLPGLITVGQATNVLFDLLLSGLFRSLGPDLAQRIAVSIAVLILVWGAFSFATAASGKRAWAVLPFLAMLAYGYVFHMGFFDFYLSLGLSFCGLATAWELTPKRLALAAPFFILAFLAHALAFAWGASFLAYLVVSKWLGPARQMQLLLAALAGVVAVRIAVSSAWATRWSADQLLLITGGDQLRVFNDNYYAPFLALLAIWALLFIGWLRGAGLARLRTNLPFQLYLVSAAGVLVLPGAIAIPGYRHALVYIAERMSLPAAVCLCAVLASARFGRFHRWAMGLVTVVFFALLFHDERALNAFEGQIGQTISPLPPGQRVLLGVTDNSFTRVDPVTHMIDRQCIGRCYSYANYEPSTWQFRVRALRPNPFVADVYADSYAMQSGQYLVKPTDLPLYQVSVDNSGILRLVSLPAGAPNRLTLVKILPDLF